MSHEFTVYLSVFDLFLTQRIKAILSKRCKPDNFESHNSLKLSCMDMQGLHSNDIISSNIDEDLLINQSAVCLSLKILMSIIRAG